VCPRPRTGQGGWVGIQQHPSAAPAITPSQLAACIRSKLPADATADCHPAIAHLLWSGLELISRLHQAARHRRGPSRLLLSSPHLGTLACQAVDRLLCCLLPSIDCYVATQGNDDALCLMLLLHVEPVSPATVLTASDPALCVMACKRRQRQGLFRLPFRASRRTALSRRRWCAEVTPSQCFVP
jgi:hypothetical protein